MNEPYDPLREAILSEFNRAVCLRYAQGVSLDAICLEYGLSKEAVLLIVKRDDQNLEKQSTDDQCAPPNSDGEA